MNSHDEFRELAALRVYGELDASERERVERHLSACAECSALARDLDAGLGRLVPPRPRDDLPLGWRADLEAAIVAGREPKLPSVPASTLWVAAASFLLGAAFAWMLASESAEGPHLQGVESDTATTASSAPFERSTPPPRARESASLPPLAELYLRR